MSERAQLTTIETVHEDGSWLFTVRDQYGELDEVLLVPCENSDEQADERDSSCDERDPPKQDGVEAWVNRCTHEAQRLDRGFGAPMRNGEIICPKHGSMFDACSGYCDNGEAADTILVSVAVAVEGGTVYLTDDAYEFAHEESVEDGGDETGDEDDGDETGNDDETGGKSGNEDSETEDESGNEDSETEDDMPSSTSHIGF